MIYDKDDQIRRYDLESRCKLNIVMSVRQLYYVLHKLLQQNNFCHLCALHL